MVGALPSRSNFLAGLPSHKKRDASRSVPGRRQFDLPVYATTHMHSTTEAAMRKVATARKTTSVNRRIPHNHSSVHNHRTSHEPRPKEPRPKEHWCAIDHQRRIESPSERAVK